MQTLLDVVNVQTQADFVLLLHFENDEQRRFDMKPYIHQKPWITLGNILIFNQAKIENGTVVWPGEIDIDPEALYERSEPA
jgi:hypothetical protein